MIVHYLDSTAWTARYLSREPGSAWITELFAADPWIASSVIAPVEVLAAIAGAVRDAAIDAGSSAQLRRAVHRDWSQIGHVPLDEGIAARACDLAASYAIRGGDAVHLASALHLRDAMTARGEDLILVTTDAMLASAARNAGVQVANPAKASDRSATARP